MNQLTKVFEGKELTIIDKENEPHFLLKNVCEILGIGNHRHVRTRLDKGVVSNYPLKTAGGMQQATFVNEDGLYDVILDSRKPEARRFRKWITSEVLPSIRKTGGYELNTSELSPELQIMNNMVRALANQELEQKRMQQELNDTKKEIDGVRQVFVLNPKNWRREVNDLIVKISKTKNSLDAYRETRLESYKRLEERARCNLTVRLENMRDRMRKAGSSKTMIERTNKMDVIASDDRLKEIYITVVKEMAIRHEVVI